LVADAEAALTVVKWLDRPEFNAEDALDRMLEKSDATDCVAAASVTVATTLDNSERSEEAKLDKAEDAAFVMDPVAVAVGLPLASDSTDDWTEETRLAKLEAADDTTPVKRAVSDAASEAAPVVSSDPVGTGTSKPPVPSMLLEGITSVPFVASASPAELAVEPSSPDATEPIRPGMPVPVLGPDVKVLLAAADGTTVLLPVSDEA
jgi:hypothetical protein